jgi:hypothetical protein
MKIGGLLCFCLIIFTSCATHTVPFASKNENTWFLEQGRGETFPIFCMANKKESTAEPVCFKAEKKNFEEWSLKSRRSN